MSNRMPRMVLLVGLICVLTPGAASEGFWSFFKGPESNVDFDNFNKWLTTGLPKNEDPQANLDYVRNNQDQLTDPKVNRSAEIFAGFLNALECNGDMLMYARDIRRNKVGLNGWKRYQKLMKSSLDRVFELCSHYIGTELKNKYNWQMSYRGLSRFLNVVVTRPHNWTYPADNFTHEPTWNFLSFTLNPHNFNLGPDLAKWRDYLTDMAKDDEYSRVYRIAYDSEERNYKKIFYDGNFEYIYNKYITEPCEALTSVIDIFKGIYAMSELQPSSDFASARKLTSTNRSLVLHLLYGFKACQDLQSKGRYAFDYIADNIELGLKQRTAWSHGKVPTA